MATLYLTEFSNMAHGSSGNLVPLALEPAVTTQNITFTSATQSAAFSGRTRFVRIFPADDCHIVFGANPTATADDEFFAAGIEYWRSVPPGQMLSVYDGSS